MHGGGERGDYNETQLTNGSELFLYKREESPAIVIFPQAQRKIIGPYKLLDQAVKKYKRKAKIIYTTAIIINIILDIFKRIKFVNIFSKVRKLSVRKFVEYGS